MSSMPIVDENGLIALEENSLEPKESAHPVWKARNALALPKGGWLYAPNEGHELEPFTRAKATQANAEEFEKTALLYLQEYGPEVASKLIKRGEAAFSIEITKETLNG